jgi:polysaccharide pyruvyl transferase WcaK-like protein
LRQVSGNSVPVQIVVEPSDYAIRNSGDTAMLQVGLERLSERFPSARIVVFSDQPETFPFRYDNVEPMETTGRRMFFDVSRSLAGRVGRDGHPRILGTTLQKCWNRWPAALLRSAIISGQRLPWAAPVQTFLRVIRQADLLIVTGMGGITDVFPEYAEELLRVVRLAQRHGARTAMFGQGLGPLEHPALRQLARATLSRLDLIALREKRAGVALCRAFGVSDQRIFVTGDDAIELAARHRGIQVGAGVGVNVRAATYSGVDRGSLGQLRSVLQAFARRAGAPLVPLPISRVPGEEDAHTIRALLAEWDPASDGGVAIDSPEKVLGQLRQCRVVVAGSYHAGVFALSSGIPVVGLVRSRYYEDKFLGLADMFGEGCEVVRLGEPDVKTRLDEAITRAWSSADQARSHLIAAADRQLADSRSAWRAPTAHSHFSRTVDS